jgi:protein-S-isoprenylcysteine O-methyltransferase Ste14
MNGVAQRPDTASTRRKLTLPRWLLLLLAVTVWPLLVFLFHGLLPWGLSGMARRFGWVEHRPGYWNWTGLGPVALAAIGFLWFWFVHTKRVSAQKTMELKFTPDYLLTDGPYQYTRNPACLAAVTLWLGWTIFYGSWVVLVATFLLWLVLHCIVIPREESGLNARHKEQYRQYLQEVRRWF